MHTSVCVCAYIGGDAYKFGGGMHTSVCVFMCWSMLVGTLSVIRLEYSVSELNMMKKKKKTTTYVVVASYVKASLALLKLCSCMEKLIEALHYHMLHTHCICTVIAAQQEHGFSGLT